MDFRKRAPSFRRFSAGLTQGSSFGGLVFYCAEHECHRYTAQDESALVLAGVLCMSLETKIGLGFIGVVGLFCGLFAVVAMTSGSGGGSTSVASTSSGAVNGGDSGQNVVNQIAEKLYNSTGSIELDAKLATMRTNLGTYDKMADLTTKSINTIEAGALSMRIEEGRWPQDLADMMNTTNQRLGRAYLQPFATHDGKVFDLWGSPMQFKFTDRVRATSNGPDLMPGTSDDINGDYYDSPQIQEYFEKEAARGFPTPDAGFLGQ